MKILELVRLTNKYLAGEQLVYSKLRPFFDQALDDVNSTLNACFPSFESLDLDTFLVKDAEYNYFPDQYVRSVIALGAAYYFYVMDEEGITTADKYEEKYRQNLFYMLRDYLDQVPLEYQSDKTGSVLISEDYFYPYVVPVSISALRGW